MRAQPRTLVLAAAAFAVALGVLAWLSPLPDRVTDRDIYEATASRGIVRDCTDLHCFRVLVPWMLGPLPGPSIVKWKAYAAISNAVAAVAVFQLCLAFGFSRRAATLASVLSAFGFGSLYTLHDTFTADPLMYALGPVMTTALVRDRIGLAGAIGAVGVLAKEFAAVPLYVFAAAQGAVRARAIAARALAAANGVFIIWLALQLTLTLAFNYGYGDSTSTHLLSGGGVGPWYAKQSPRGALSAVFNEFGALYLLAPAGFLLAPPIVRRLAIASIPPAALFAYVQQPDRALWNFHFLVAPLAALVLERAPAAIAWTTVALFVAANLRVGAQLAFVPAARFALAASVIFAAAAIVLSARRGGGASSTWTAQTVSA
jgi:hypothetical protein